MTRNQRAIALLLLASLNAFGFIDRVVIALVTEKIKAEFRVSDLDATYAELLARGATPVWDPRPSPEPGVRMAFVADPEGNLVEFIAAVSSPAAPGTA